MGDVDAFDGTAPPSESIFVAPSFRATFRKRRLSGGSNNRRVKSSALCSGTRVPANKGKREDRHSNTSEERLDDCPELLEREKQSSGCEWDRFH